LIGKFFFLVDYLLIGIDFKLTITREEFEKLNESLFMHIFNPIMKAMLDAKVEKTDINEIVLVGGSTRIPKIQQLLKAFFDGKDLNKSINPDEAVASGAAIMGAILIGDKSEEVRDVLLIDVAPFSLGIEVPGAKM
jgi:heat shock protein 1/8